MQPLHASIYTDQSYDLANVNVARLDANDAHEGNLILKSATRLLGIGLFVLFYSYCIHSN